MRLVPRRSRTWILVLLLLLVLAGALSYLVWRQSVPDVRVTAAPRRFVGQKTPLTFLIEAARGNVARAEVRVVQGDQPVVVVKREEPPRRDRSDAGAGGRGPSRGRGHHRGVGA